MLTNEQREIFALMTGVERTNGNEDDRETLLDEAVCEPEAVIATRDALSAFQATWKNSTRKSGEPETYEFGGHTIYVWQGVQRRKGEQRGRLYVMDFGEFRGTYFAN